MGEIGAEVKRVGRRLLSPGGHFADVDREVCRDRVAMKHLHRFARIFHEILADEPKLLDHVIGCGDNVAADLISLKDVEKLARTGPEQFGFGPRRKSLFASAHMRNRVAPRIRDSAAED